MRRKSITKVDPYAQRSRNLWFWIMVILLVVMISKSSCRVSFAQESPYQLPVHVMSVDSSRLGYLVTVRHRHMLFQYRYAALPDSIRAGRDLLMPVWKRVR